jgi:hypothetical protein
VDNLQHKKRIESDSANKPNFCKEQRRKNASNFLRFLCGRYILHGVHMKNFVLTLLLGFTLVGCKSTPEKFLSEPAVNIEQAELSKYWLNRDNSWNKFALKALENTKYVNAESNPSKTPVLVNTKIDFRAK